MTVPIVSTTPENEKNLWRTPEAVFKRANSLYGPFDLDAAADSDNHLCDLWLGPGSPLGNEDALSCDWGSDGWWRVWCNPPYQNGMWAAFLHKASEQVRYGTIRSATLLVPAATDHKVFHELVWNTNTNSPRPFVTVDFLKGRVRFLRPNGKPAGTPTFGSMLVTFGK